MGENETFVGAENMLGEYGVDVINLGTYFDVTLLTFGSERS